ncbi:hypothetical protein HN587_03700 [Candidatus Woesearchaeota archaeon]|jgi:hypothetical protein|nr:hypothetical protein [Candidatus Woesearchaeota archaeon]
MKLKHLFLGFVLVVLLAVLSGVMVTAIEFFGPLGAAPIPSNWCVEDSECESDSYCGGVYAGFVEYFPNGPTGKNIIIKYNYCTSFSSSCSSCAKKEDCSLATYGKDSEFCFDGKCKLSPTDSCAPSYTGGSGGKSKSAYKYLKLKLSKGNVYNFAVKDSKANEGCGDVGGSTTTPGQCIDLAENSCLKDAGVFQTPCKGKCPGDLYCCPGKVGAEKHSLEKQYKPAKSGCYVGSSGGSGSGGSKSAGVGKVNRIICPSALKSIFDDAEKNLPNKPIPKVDFYKINNLYGASGSDTSCPKPYVTETCGVGETGLKYYTFSKGYANKYINGLEVGVCTKPACKLIEITSKMICGPTNNPACISNSWTFGGTDKRLCKKSAPKECFTSYAINGYNWIKAKDTAQLIYSYQGDLSQCNLAFNIKHPNTKIISGPSPASNIGEISFTIPTASHAQWLPDEIYTNTKCESPGGKCTCVDPVANTKTTIKNKKMCYSTCPLSESLADKPKCLAPINGNGVEVSNGYYCKDNSGKFYVSSKHCAVCNQVTSCNSYTAGVTIPGGGSSVTFSQTQCHNDVCKLAQRGISSCFYATNSAQCENKGAAPAAEVEVTTGSLKVKVVNKGKATSGVKVILTDSADKEVPKTVNQLSANSNKSVTFKKLKPGMYTASVFKNECTNGPAQSKKVTAGKTPAYATITLNC